jgi:hypothetical protein
MYDTELLLKEVDNCILAFTDEEYDDMANSEDNITILKKACDILYLSNDYAKIKHFNKIILIHLSSLKDNYNNCFYFIERADNTIWNYILEHFDDEKINSVIVVLYLCIVNVPIQTEHIIKLFKILFADRRMCDLVTQTEIFYNKENSKNGNARMTLMGILFYKISESDTYYVTRVQKMVELLYIFLRNRDSRSKLLTWLTRLINDNKNFKNNLSFYEEYDKGFIDTKYYKLLSNVIFILWDNAKKNDKNRLDNINMEYLQNPICLLEWEDKNDSLNGKCKFFDDIFYIFMRLQNLFFNNFESMIMEYEKYIAETKIQLRSLQISGLNEDIKNKILDSLIETELNRDNLNNIISDVVFCNSLKIFQKDCADIININIKKNVKILDSVLETNIDLINSLKIFNDGFYNYNYINFENSVILLNYKQLSNPHIKNKYCIYSSYYIVDNTSRNICDLRYKYITHNLIPNLLNFYIVLEDLEDDNFYEKNLARTNIINFFNFICFKEPMIYAEQLRIYCNSSDKKYVRFINLYINDLSCIFDETFTIIRDINKIEKENISVSLSNIEDIYNDRPRYKELYKKYKYLDAYLSTLNFMLSFLLTLSKYSETTLLSKELGVKFCSQINYFLNEITNENKRNSYIIKNKYDIRFSPINLLENIIKVILNLIKNPYIIEYMSKDVRSFRKENIVFTIQKLWSNHLLSESEFRNLERMADKIDYLMEKDKEDIELPDEFCDPLMASEIVDPVILPGTDTIMDMSVIMRHLLTDQHNPFNRDKLTLDELEKYNSKDDIKEKIKIFNCNKQAWKKENL